MSKTNGQVPKIKLGDVISKPSSKPRSKVHFEDLVFSDTWPALYQLLAAAIDEDGAPREGASLILFAESDRLKTCIVDKHTGQRAFCVMISARPILDQVEEFLRLGVEWREKSAKPAGTPIY